MHYATFVLISLFRFRIIAYLAVVTFPILVMYLYAPKHFSPTMDPLQSDSWVYICQGLKNSNLNSNNQLIVIEKLSKWVQQTIDPSTCSNGSPWFAGRIVLPFLISVSTFTANPILVYFPTLLIYAYICFAWFILVGKKHDTFSMLILILPFLSTHIGWHLTLVLTDGPMIAGLLTLLLLHEKVFSKENFNKMWYLVFIFSNFWTLYSRQSWPYLIAINIYVLFKGSRISRGQEILPKIALIFGAPIFFLISANSSNPRYPGSTQINSLLSAARSLMSDTWSMITHFDIGGLIILMLLTYYFLYVVLQRVINFEFIVYLILNLLCSISVAAAYWSNPVYGQNWRLHLPAIFFGLYVASKQLGPLPIFKIRK
jgi:hypothetical protein